MKSILGFLLFALGISNKVLSVKRNWDHTWSRFGFDSNIIDVDSRATWYPRLVLLMPRLFTSHTGPMISRLQIYQHLRQIGLGHRSKIRLSPCHFCSLDSGNFLSPTGGRLHLLHRTQLIRRVTWNTNIVVALKNELDVT